MRSPTATPSPQATKPVCRHCGTAIAGAPYARDGDEWCCEGCFLAARLPIAPRNAGDETLRSLGEVLVAALDTREHETGLHSKRVACHTLVLARHFTSDAAVLQQVYLGALLHDIGKIGIPDAVLLKQGPLSEAEWQIMRTHPKIGHSILSGVSSLTVAAGIVLAHEERFDGNGYPGGLKGQAIPLWARLFAVIDTLDAMTSDRPYRNGLSFDDARAEIRRLAGTQFDPEAVQTFIAEEAALREMVALKCGTASASSTAPVAPSGLAGGE